MRTLTLAVQIRLPLVRIEYVLAFQIGYCKLCVKKLMKGRHKVLFPFLFSLELSPLNFIKIWAFTSSLLKVLSLLYFSIIFNNWRKSVVKPVFLSVSTVLLVIHYQKHAIFKFLFIFHFIIFSSLCSHPLLAQLLFLIVLHNGIKKYSHEEGLICDVVSEQRITQSKKK